MQQSGGAAFYANTGSGFVEERGLCDNHYIETPPEEILQLDVDMTMVDGEIVYEKI